MTRGEKAAQFFLQGYNCSQSVCLAFQDLTGMDESMLLRLSSSFGGGMGRMREVCGSVSGMLMVAGLLYGYDDPKDHGAKTTHYARVRALADEFRAKNGSIVCRELLQNCKTTPGGVPEQRTQTYYQTRPCVRMVTDAANTLERYIQENPIL